MAENLTVRFFFCVVRAFTPLRPSAIVDENLAWEANEHALENHLKGGVKQFCM